MTFYFIMNFVGEPHNDFLKGYIKKNQNESKHCLTIINIYFPGYLNFI